MKAAVGSFVSGLLFAIGLAVSGMTDPHRVVAFLDFAGAWDPSLMWVMVGAIGIYLPGYLLVKRRRIDRDAAPLLADRFDLPTRRTIDAPLVTGAILFGIGWGVAGLCPAPAITNLVILDPQTILFVVAMVAGMTMHRLYAIARSRRHLGATLPAQDLARVAPVAITARPSTPPPA